MDLKADSIVGSLKQNGGRITAISIISAICLGVIDQFGSRVVPSIADYIRDTYDPPAFYVNFAPPIDSSSRITISSLRGAQTSEVAMKPTKAPNIYTALAGPGTYLLQIQGTAERIGKELVTTRRIEKNGEMWPVDSSDRNWANASELKSGSPTTPASPAVPETPRGRLSNTRWTVTDQDYAVLLQIEDRVLRSLISTALGEVGIFENGNDWEKKHIAAYWQAVGPNWSDAQQQNMPWGGAFVAWVVAQTYLVPPPSPAAFQSWRQWNKEVPIAEIRPGLIGVFQLTTSEVPQSRSRLLVGPIIRRHRDCTEAIIGNVSDRVVITCIANELLVSVRHPGQS